MSTTAETLEDSFTAGYIERMKTGTGYQNALRNMVGHELIGNYREQAEKALTEALRTVSDEVPEAEAVKTLRAAYPFKERKGSPYRAWLRELERVLLRRYPTGQRADRLLTKLENRVRAKSLSPIEWPQMTRSARRTP